MPEKSVSSESSNTNINRPLEVVILATEYCAAAGVHGILDILATANFCHRRQHPDAGPVFHLHIVTLDDQPVRAYNRSLIHPTTAIASVKPDIVGVASTVEAIGSLAAFEEGLGSSETVVQWIQNWYRAGAVMVAVCSGNFLLAEAGLLAGKTVTTHWRTAEYFRQRYPDIRLQPEKMLIDNGDVISAGGSTAYMELCFHLIERFASTVLASECAKLHLIDGPREDQSAYRMFSGYKSHKDLTIMQAQQWMEDSYARSFAIDEVAEAVGLGARTFKRRFKLATGLTPIAYLQQIRIEAAKHLLETTRTAVSSVIWAVGYEDVSSFARLFKRETGCTMEEYRKRFGYIVPTPQAGRL